MTSSTFQCIVQVLTKFNSHVLLSYSEYKINSRGTLSIDKSTNKTINIPSKYCFKNICILYIISRKGQTVNDTVIDAISPARLVPSCTYAGFSTGYLVQKNYKEQFTICDSHERNSYSQNSPLIIVLYWYEDLSYINVTILVSQTECKPVIIDPCILPKSCSDKESCSAHLKSTDTFELEYAHEYLKITYLKTRCIILLLESSNVQKK